MGSTGTGANQGTCKHFKADKGYGFIMGADGNEVFMHIEGFVDGSYPQQGDTLTYDLEPSRTRPGQMRAINVTGGTGWAGGGGGGGGYGKANSWGMKGGKDGPYGGGGWACGNGGYGKANSWGMKGGKAGPYGGGGW